MMMIICYSHTIIEKRRKTISTYCWVMATIFISIGRCRWCHQRNCNVQTGDDFLLCFHYGYHFRWWLKLVSIHAIESVSIRFHIFNFINGIGALLGRKRQQAETCIYEYFSYAHLMPCLMDRYLIFQENIIEWMMHCEENF
jgi:hypothetical protein